MTAALGVATGPARWTFVSVEGVDPTNNFAERILRQGVLWRKGSFGTDSPNGSRFVERILTVVTTLRLQKRNVLDYMTAACEAALHGTTSPSLLPASTPLPSSSLSLRWSVVAPALSAERQGVRPALQPSH